MKGLRSSLCPVTTTLDLIGDKWTLLIIRDIIFQDKTTYNELLESVEGIATNILAGRLKSLEENGLIIKRASQFSKLKSDYLLTEKGISLLPLILEVVIWGTGQLPEKNENSVFKELKKSKSATLKKYNKLLKDRLYSGTLVP